MRKIYKDGYSGQDPETWQRIWYQCQNHRQQVFNLLIFEAVLAMIEAEVKKGDRILEGGCGPGHFVFYFWKSGYDIIGVDFDGNTVNAVKKEFKGIPVQTGDITNLSFPDHYFDVYFSGGVIEHFEEGFEKTLQEARRVLKPGGKFLVIVPYQNVIRGMSNILKKTLLPKRYYNGRNADGSHQYSICREPYIDHSGKTFYQYVCDRRYVHRELKRHGFLIEGKQVTQLYFGMTDLSLFRRWFSASVPKDKGTRHLSLSDDALYWLIKNSHRKVPQKFGWEALHREKCTNEVWQAFINVLRPIFGNVAFYTARKIDK